MKKIVKRTSCLAGGANLKLKAEGKPQHLGGAIGFLKVLTACQSPHFAKFPENNTDKFCVFRNDDLVKSRLSGESRIGSGAGSGVQGIYKPLKLLDSGSRLKTRRDKLRRNDEKSLFQSFFEFNNFLDFKFSGSALSASSAVDSFF